MPEFAEQDADGENVLYREWLADGRTGYVAVELFSGYNGAEPAYLDLARNNEPGELERALAVIEQIRAGLDKAEEYARDFLRSAESEPEPEGQG